MRHNPAIEAHPFSALDCLTVNLRWSDESGQYVATIRELDGLGNVGSTEKEALDRTAAMLLDYLDVAEEQHMRLPWTKAQVKRIREALA
jgi:predicted RNase H-like HicB family nuclease